MQFRYLLFNKPFNVLCQFTREGNHTATLADYIQVPDVYPAGRLDHDSEGLVLLTNDGPLIHRLTDPKFAHARTYWVQVEGIPSESALYQLSGGILLNNYKTRPALARVIDPPPVWPRTPPIRVRKSIPDSWIELTLTEGKNRQVRRMTAAVFLPTLRLIRYAIGPLTLDGLAPGQWRELDADELRQRRRARS